MTDVKAGAVDKSSGRVRAMFSDIALNYDRLNHLLSANQDKLWRRRAIRLVGPKRGQLVLDLCCGTGDLGIECHHQQPQCRIIGADFAVPMLQHATGKTRQNAGTHVFLAGDALHLPFAAETFDIVMIGFGVRNFEDTAAGLCEIRRVLKPGGKILVLEFMRPTSPVVQRFFSGFNIVLAPVGRAISGHESAYNYLPQSIGGFYTRWEFHALLRRCGFHNIRSFDHSAGVATSFIANATPLGPIAPVAGSATMESDS